ncbi:serine hydrolase domain-containing protein [Photorhabdus caribbeanensis]|uniref:serine hydrolase domain-containing protein n=1 Tax=Photorhabdus caribbeanensis TaxID=1004165 RepID=UPI001BD29538|nr:serine hydrolase domain-containing protein [Photorhabdus caribbeanensis]MBS9422606.1 class A beta-lactamase-related serine hydrolase [Photorhabdus caribbeanensis]
MMESAISENNINSFIKKIDELVNVENKKKGGALAVAVTHGNKTIYQRHIGKANIEHTVAVKPNTKFYLASVSKQFTAFCIALLEKEGKLCIKDKVRQYLDYFPAHFSDITIEHLIHHTSGLRDQFGLYNLAGKNSDFDHRHVDLVRKLSQRQQMLNFTPGEYYLYNNTGYNLLAEIVRVVSGKSLREYAKENVFVPLKMKDTFFYDDITEIISDRAMGYIYNEALHQWRRNDLNDAVVGGSGLYSTVSDLCRWIRAFYSPSIVRELLPQLSRMPDLTNGDRNNYAYGLIISQREGQTVMRHGGFYGGFRSDMFILPDAKLGIAITSATSTDVDKFIKQGLDALFNTGITEPGKQPCRISDIDITGIFKGVDPFPYIITKEECYLLGNLFEKGNPIIFNSDGTFQEENGQILFRPIIENDRVVALEQINESGNVSYLKKMIDKGDIDIQRFSGRYYNHETESIINIEVSSDDLYIDAIILPGKKQVLRWVYENSYFLPGAGIIIDFELNSDTNEPRLYLNDGRCWKIEFVPV